MMNRKPFLFGLVLSIAAVPALAADGPSVEERAGVGVGMVVGGVAGGPIGAIVGAAIGAKFGDEFYKRNEEVDALSASLTARKPPSRASNVTSILSRVTSVPWTTYCSMYVSWLSRS